MESSRKQMLISVIACLLCMADITVATPVINPVPEYPARNPIASQAQSCATCHNSDGNSSVAAWPSIAGQPAKYLLQQLRSFREGKQGSRPNAVMQAIVEPLSEQELQDLVDYFSLQKIAVGSTPQRFVALGEQIYRGGNSKTGVPACAACHGAAGHGNVPAGFPALSGQQPEYVMQQLQDFRKGHRNNDANNIMQDISKAMSDAEIAAVAHYVRGLQE